jgi:hypothetical protein
MLYPIELRVRVKPDYCLKSQYIYGVCLSQDHPFCYTVTLDMFIVR